MHAIVGGPGMGARVRLATLVAVEAGLVAGLHAVGRSPHLSIDLADVPAWLATAAPADAVAAAVRVVALGCAYWLLATTVGYVLAQAAGWEGLRRWLRAVTHASVRRAAEGALAAAVAASTLSLAGPVAAAAPVGSQATPADAGADGFLPPGLSPPGEQVVQPVTTADTDLGAWHEVRPGDHLWGIAVRTLRDAGGGAVDTRDVGRYWLALIAANADRLRSGDPDLVHPGERLVLPRVPGR